MPQLANEEKFANWGILLFLYYYKECFAVIYIFLNSDGVQLLCILNIRIKAEILEKPHWSEISVIDISGSINNVAACIMRFLFKY